MSLDGERLIPHDQVNTGSGSVAAQGGVAAGASGVAIGGDVSGTVVIAHEGAVVLTAGPTRDDSGVRSRASIPMAPEPHFVHAHPLQDHFVGRSVERRLLTDWFVDGRRPLLAVTAIGGTGKSALSWTWLLHDVLGTESLSLPENARPEGVLWWSFYERAASFASFVDEALVYASDGSILPTELPSGFDKTKTLINLLRQRRLLVVLDGFERELEVHAGVAGYGQGATARGSGWFRACVDQRAAEFLRSVASTPTSGRLLMTSRYLPRELDGLAGLQRLELGPLRPDDAVRLFRAHNIRGPSKEIDAACKAVGYHSLSLSLLAGMIVKDKRDPGDVAAVHRHSIVTALKGRQSHPIFEVAFETLSAEESLLLSSIAACRGSVPYAALSIFNTGGDDGAFDAALDVLVERGMLLFDTARRRFDLHPLVRQYAYGRLTPSQQKMAHNRLRLYFAKLVRHAEPGAVGHLAELIEQYYHTAKSGRYADAYTILHDELFEPLHYRFGEYQLNIELVAALFPRGVDKPPRLRRRPVEAVTRAMHTGTAYPPKPGYESPQVWALTSLGISYRAAGFPAPAVPLFKAAVQICEQFDDTAGLVVGLINLSDVQWTVGAFKSVDENLRRQIALSNATNDEMREAVGHQDLGLRLAFRGKWAEADSELRSALELSLRMRDAHRQVIVWSQWARKELLHARAANPPADVVNRALAAASQAMQLLDNRVHERHYVRACWLIGAANSLLGDSTSAKRHLDEALTECNRINLVEFESDILVELARLGLRNRSIGEARSRACQAMEIAERRGYVLAGADACILLARTALADNDNARAKKYAEQAYLWAQCDGPPNYTYKVAYDEATMLLEQIAGGIAS
jgi:tetratricopeptide (TPR) repeat protein